MIATSALLLMSVALGQTTDVTYADTWTNGISYPARMAPVPTGGLYVTDPPLLQVVQYDTAGDVVGTFAVSAGPIGIAVHNDRRVFLSREDGQIGAYSSAFAFQSTVNPAPLTMTRPIDLAVDPTSNLLYAVDSGANRVLVFQESGPGVWTLLRSWGSLGSGLGQFRSPQAIAVDPATDHVIVVDTDNFRAQVFDLNGTFLFKFGYRILYTTTSEVAWFARGAGVDVDSCSNIFIADALMGTVRGFDRFGKELGTTHTPFISYGDVNPGEVRVPCDVTIDIGNQLYVASTNNAAVEVYTIDCPGGPASDGSDDGGNAPEIEAMQSMAHVAALVRPVRQKIPYPDNPIDIVTAMRTGQYDAALDLSRDRAVTVLDLQMAIAHFGVGTVEDFERMADGGVATDPVDPPHLLDMTNRCSRCHSMDGAPVGGILTAEGQENLCLSCHSSGQIAHKLIIGGVDRGMSHPWGMPANDADPGPALGSEIALHLDSGDVRCGTCHNQHESWQGDCQFAGVAPATPQPYVGRCVDGPFAGLLCQHDDQCDNRYLRASGDTAQLCGQCHKEYDEWLVAGHSHEHADPWSHYDWSMGSTHLCTAAGVPFACCTGNGTGTNCSGNLVCTGAGEPNTCCTGPGTGSCSNRETCRRCHSGDGYVDFSEGKITSKQRGHFRVADCLTCHTTHGKAEDESLLKIFDDVTLPSGQAITGVGSSATCISCHNGRAIPPNPNPPGVTTPHYLNGGAMLEGINAVTTFDGIAYNLISSQHTQLLNGGSLGCASCHMGAGPTSGPAVGKVGGHTFKIVDNDSGYENVDTTCNSAACHEGVTTINVTANGNYDGIGGIQGIQTETAGLLNLLKTALYNIGASRLLLDPDTGLPTDESNPHAEPANPYWTTRKCVGGTRNGLYCNGTTGAGTAPFDCTGGGTCSLSVPSGDVVTVEDAIWNWEYVENSGDLGVKNTGYAIGLLQIAYKGVTNTAVPSAQYRYTPAP